jgi:hypothetical protein
MPIPANRWDGMPRHLAKQLKKLPAVPIASLLRWIGSTGLPIQCSDMQTGSRLWIRRRLFAIGRQHVVAIQSAGSDHAQSAGTNAPVRRSSSRIFLALVRLTSNSMSRFFSVIDNSSVLPLLCGWSFVQNDHLQGLSCGSKNSATSEACRCISSASEFCIQDCEG